MASIAKAKYGERAAKHPVKAAQQLLSCIERKQTNLCVSVDVTTKSSLLRIADAAGPYCCCIKVRLSTESPSGVPLTCVAKTHIDIVSDFDKDLVDQLVALANKHDFLIWEDRKFADIGEPLL